MMEIESREYTFEPLEVTFTLGSPVVLSFPWLNFDGYIAYATGEEIYGTKWYAMQERHPDSHLWDNLPVPLERRDLSGGDFYYHASVSRFEHPESISTRKYQKLFPDEGIEHNATRKRSYMIVGGQFKLRSIQYITNTSRTVRFWCKGDHDHVNRYCETIQGLGLRVAAGNGKVIGVDVKRVVDDWSIQHPEFGLNRPVPVKDKNIEWLPTIIASNAILSYKPPNWSKLNQVPCYIPGGFV